MQAAFVDIGLERAAFLHARDIWVKDRKGDGEVVDTTANISDLVYEGHSIVVQVTKDMIGTKGARLTTLPFDSFPLSGVHALHQPYWRVAAY